MKILLVHPDDSVDVGPWAETTWDQVIDLGWSGHEAYAQQAERFGCRVRSIYDLLDHERHRCWLRELIDVGLDQLVDSGSVDWWEVFSSSCYQQLEQVMLSSVLAGQVPDDAHIFATRPHLVMHALSLMLKRRIKTFSSRQNTEMSASRFWKKMLALRPSQIIEIAFDKWDAGLKLRRLVSRRPAASTTPAVLLPSAYVNVSRAQLAYAQMLPQRRFLLVVTRHSGRRVSLPANVDLLSLASYAPGFSHSTERERVRLVEKWQQLQEDRFAAHPVLGFATKLRMFDGFARFLGSGLRVRDAWREVITREPITAVLSADEHNAFTRLPVLLARSRKLPTVFCDHGALNMSFAIRRACSDVYLASGDMARDYMTGWCGLPAERIMVGGPAKTHSSLPPSAEKARDWIVYFSEQYELFPARTQTLYSELLPELCALARQTNRKVIIKLHPFESLRVRKAIIEKALSAQDRGLIEMRTGAMTPDLFERAWFSVTVESSVAVESTRNGVPCFLCGWFDASWYDYAKQYAKYSAGYWLDSPRKIREIPHLLDGIKITDATQRALHTSISAEHLDSMLFLTKPGKR